MKRRSFLVTIAAGLVSLATCSSAIAGKNELRSITNHILYMVNHSSGLIYPDSSRCIEYEYHASNIFKKTKQGEKSRKIMGKAIKNALIRDRNCVKSSNPTRTIGISVPYHCSERSGGYQESAMRANNKRIRWFFDEVREKFCQCPNQIRGICDVEITLIKNQCYENWGFVRIDTSWRNQ